MNDPVKRALLDSLGELSAVFPHNVAMHGSPVARHGAGRYLALMPTVLRSGPYRFFFYSGDRDEPPHVHVERDDAEAKFWLDPVRLEWSRGFSRKELGTLQALVEENRDQMLESWHEYFDG